MTATPPPLQEQPKGITCPKCGCADLRRMYTRQLAGCRTRRVRICRNCGKRVVTIEAAVGVKPRNLTPG